MNETKTMRISVAALAVAFTFTLAGLAEADLAPPDACMTKGAACDNAGEKADQPGTCEATTCTRQTPDGPMTYECLRCRGSQQGTGGSGAGGASTVTNTNTTTGTTSNTGGSAGAPKKDDDGGCSVSAVGKERALAGVLFAVGLGAVILSRRGRAPAKRA